MAGHDGSILGVRDASVAKGGLLRLLRKPKEQESPELRRLSAKEPNLDSGPVSALGEEGWCLCGSVASWPK